MTSATALEPSELRQAPDALAQVRLGILDADRAPERDGLADPVGMMQREQPGHDPAEAPTDQRHARRGARREIELLGYSAVWLPEAVGRDPLVLAASLLSATSELRLATGIANIWEVCHHLRGEAGDRQIEGAKVGLAHVIGLGSACGVHILEKSAA